MAGTDARMIVQPRDIALLQECSVMRVMDRAQAMLAGSFGSVMRVNTRLLALTRAGLLRRFFIGSDGGRKAIYALSPKGAQLAEVPLRGPRRKQNEMLVADFFVQHQLSLNEVYCGLKFGTPLCCLTCGSIAGSRSMNQLFQGSP